MPRIDNAFFGSIIIDGKKYDTDVLVASDGEVVKREKSHTFTKQELMDLLMMKEPEVIIIGTGMAGYVKVHPDAEVFAKLNGIELLAMPTGKAVQEFNRRSKRGKVVAVIHVTD